MTPADDLAPESHTAALHAELVDAERGITAQDWFYDCAPPDPSEYEEERNRR